MATKEQVLGILAGASGPMSRAEVEEKVGESFRSLQTQFVNRWMKTEHLIEDVGDQHYVLTDKGREEALKIGEFKEIDKEPGFAGKPGSGTPEPTDESLATTEYQQFLRLGKLTGVVPLALIKQTADHVWEGGDFRDMKWVAQAMMEMDIRKDLRGRWLHSWRTKMHQPIPTDLPAEFSPTEGKKLEGKKEAKGKRDYILNEDDNPTYVGEGLGDLDHDEAFDLARIKAGAAARRKDTSPLGTSSPIDDVIKIVNLVKSTEGEKAVGKSYVVKPGEDGGFQVEEAESGKPILVQASPEAKPGPSFYVGSDGEVKELPAGQPVVIIKEPPKSAAPSGTHYLIDQKTGDVKEVAPGQPVVIIRESGQSQSTPIQVKDKDGNPMVLDLGTFIKLEEHRDRQRRDEESHETKMEIAKSFKDMLNKAGTALSNTVEGEEEK